MVSGHDRKTLGPSEGINENNIWFFISRSEQMRAECRVSKKAKTEQPGRPGRKPALNAVHTAVLRAITQEQPRSSRTR